jgi:hypothetical protein
LSLSASLAHANTEEGVTSPFSGSQPFMIVHADQSGPSTREAGLYLRNGSDWKLLMPGTVLMDPARGPVFHHLALSKLDDRLLASAVVNGKLVLFHVLSDQEDPESYIELGPDLPVAEVATGTKRFLPAISSAQDVAVFQDEKSLLSGERQLVLVSIKNPAPAAIADSDGVTIALRLKKSEGPRLVLDGDPLIIDNRFHPVSVLQGMILKKTATETLVYSEILQQSFLGRLNVENFGEYNNLVGRLASRQAHCQEQNTSFCPTADLAAWNADNGSALYRDAITLDEKYGEFSFGLKWQLFSGGIPTLLIRAKNSQVQLTGRIRLDQNRTTMWTVADQARTAVLFAIEDELYVAHLIQNQIKIGKLDMLPDFNHPTRTQVMAVPDPADPNSVHLIVSAGFLPSAADPKKPENWTGWTRRYLLSAQSGLEQMSVRDRASLADTYYHADFEERFHLAREIVGFDNLTPASSDVHEYLQARDESAPYIDLLKSVDGAAEHIFTNPSKEETLADRLTYREFSYREVGKNPTGLYFRPERLSESFFPGTALMKPGTKTLELLNQGAPVNSQRLGTLSAKLFALDPTNRDGQYGFSLILHLEGEHEGRQWSTAFALPKMNFKFENLASLRFVAGRKEHSNELYLLFSGDQNDEPHYIQVTVDLENGQPKITAQARRTELRLSSPDELMERLVYDQTGEIYLIKTPGVSPNSREFEVLKMSTGARSFPKREHGANSVVFDFDTNMNDLFLAMSTESRLSWKLQPFRREESETASKSGNVQDLAKSQLFAQFRMHLSEAADMKQPPKRKIIVVPPEIKDLAMKFVRESYLVKSQRDVKDGNQFHRYNRSLGVYIFDPNRSEPDAFFENFEIAKSRPNERSVILADIGDVLAVERPTSRSESSPFLLKIPDVAGPLDHASGDGSDTAPVSIEHREVTPHALYLLAAGAPVEYEEFRKKPPEPVATTILVGTQDEVQELFKQADDEVAAGIDKVFETVELPLPTMESKTEMLANLMDRPDIKGLGFEFDSSQISETPAADQAEARQKIFEYAVTRTEAVSRPRGDNPFSAFMEFQRLFSEKILTDPIVRNTRKIDRSFIERVVTMQFNLPLNLSDLPPDDPRRILSGDDAVFRMQKAGMLGEFDLKAEIIRLTLAQLNYDPTRVMPSTWIWAGEPGTGKTKAWQALVKMLNLKLHVRGDKSGGANAFYLDTVRVSKAKGLRAVEETINELNDFIASPKGSTGFIFIDDLHFADEELGKAIVQWIRSLQQAEKGVYRFQRSDGSWASISVQNLTIGVAMNFTDNKALLQQFKGEDVSALIGKIVATGSRFGMDKSFVDRFGGVYNFDKFHESVKEPSLNEALLEAAQKKLARTGQFVIVDPELVRLAAHAFPDMGARPFLSKSTDAIISQPDQIHLGTSKVFALIPKNEKEIEEATASLKTGSRTGAWGEESSEVKTWATVHSHVIELEHGLAAPLMLTRLMIPSFRSPILESLVYSLQTDPRFKNDKLSRTFFLAPALFAAYDHLMRAETIPLKELKLEEAQFGIKTTAEREEFQRLVEDLSVTSTPFVVPFPSSGGRLSLWAELGVGGQKAVRTESRRDVLLSYTNKLYSVVERHLLRILYIRDLRDLEQTELWLQSLPERVPFDSEVLGRELNDLMFQFMKDFHSSDLLEASRSNSPAMEPYVASRFFFMALDQAIARLPWADLGQKMVKALKLITQDQVLGQSVGVQNWLFNPEGRASLLKPTTTNMIREMVGFNKTVRETPSNERESNKTKFESNCEAYLMGRGN